MELSSVFGGDSLKAADLQGNEPTVIISGVEMKKFDNGNKLVITFEGKKKCLVCNKTNANRISMMYGTNTDLWVGNELVLYTDLVAYQGKEVEAIRVRVKRVAPQPAAAPVRRSSADMGRDDFQPQGAAPRRAAEMDDEIPFHAEHR